MKDSDPKRIEQQLRNASSPTPPPELQAELRSDAMRLIPQAPISSVRSGGLMGFWIPRLGFALVFLSAAAFITAQSSRYPSADEVRKSLLEAEKKRQELLETQKHRSQKQGRYQYLQELKRQQQEIEQLASEKEKLTALVNESRRLEHENTRLREELAQLSGPESYLTRDPLGEARDRARGVQCVNNLKNLSLGYQIARHEGESPTRFRDILKHVPSKTLFCCPKDTDAIPLSNDDPKELGPENISYDWLIQDPDSAHNQTIVFRCEVHDHLALFDGSVHRGQDLTERGAEFLNEGNNRAIRLPKPRNDQ